MSKLFNSPITQETGPQASGRPLPTWRVKLSNGAVYGPIELGELRTWAAECRLAPGDQVSSDTGHWANAETLPELTMQWMVEMASGEIFGPVHLHAVVDFFHSRLVLPSSRLTNRVTGETSTVADLVLPLIPDAARDDFLAGTPVVADNATSDDRLIRFNRNTSTTRLPPDQHKEKLLLRIEQLQAMVDESESRIKQLQRDLDSQQAQTLKLRDDKAALEKTYLVKLGNAHKNEAGMRDIQDRLDCATSDYDSMLNNLREKESSLSTAVRERDLALQSARALTERYEARAKELTRQIEVLTADQTAMRSALEQNRAEFEQARQETRKPATPANKLTERISVFDRELKTVRGEWTRREADIKGMFERAISMENSATEAGNETEQPKIRCQGLQEQLGQTKGEFKRREMPQVAEKSGREREYPGSLERKSMIPPLPDRQKMNYTSEKKVLVVDDSVVIQQLITKLAEKYGASVTAAASARDVAGILAEKARRFDLFVLDLMLPEITGWEILETLRARPETKDTPIVMLTGQLSSKEKEKILQKANAVIEKSKFTLRDFNKVLNQWL